MKTGKRVGGKKGDAGSFWIAVIALGCIVIAAVVIFVVDKIKKKKEKFELKSNNVKDLVDGAINVENPYDFVNSWYDTLA